MPLPIFCGCIIAYIFGMYLWQCKIVQQELRDLQFRLKNIQYSISLGIITLPELILLASDTSNVSELDTPKGLIEQLESMQKSFSFSLKFQYHCIRNITHNIDPRIRKWEKEIKKLVNNSENSEKIKIN